MREKEYYDLCYDVWRSGGNPDIVERDRYEEYDFVYDEYILRQEMNRQNKSLVA